MKKANLLFLLLGLGSSAFADPVGKLEFELRHLAKKDQKIAKTKAEIMRNGTGYSLVVETRDQNCKKTKATLSDPIVSVVSKTRFAPSCDPTGQYGGSIRYQITMNFENEATKKLVDLIAQSDENYCKGEGDVETYDYVEGQNLTMVQEYAEMYDCAGHRKITEGTVSSKLKMSSAGNQSLLLKVKMK